MVEKTREKISKIKIKEASIEDMGKGIVKLGPEIMKNLNLRIGDVIEIYYAKTRKKNGRNIIFWKRNH